jgi:nucleoside triphosphate diphosphatase
MGTGDGGRGTGKTSPLIMAYRIQERAARLGFDWPDTTGPIGKVKEELAEVERATSNGQRAAIEDEIGDLLFAVVNLARKLAIDPSAALERANEKFKGRFERVEDLARERGLELGRASLEELDKLWVEVKESGG